MRKIQFILVAFMLNISSTFAQSNIPNEVLGVSFGSSLEQTKSIMANIKNCPLVFASNNKLIYAPTFWEGQPCENLVFEFTDNKMFVVQVAYLIPNMPYGDIDYGAINTYSQVYKKMCAQYGKRDSDYRELGNYFMVFAEWQDEKNRIEISLFNNTHVSLFYTNKALENKNKALTNNKK